MLNTLNRLTKRKEFGYVYKKGKYANNNILTILYVDTKLKNPRFGFSISKKIGKAHVRNKIKRQLREIVREFLPSIVPNHNYVFVVKPEIVNLNFSQIKEQTNALLKKANLLC